MKIAIVLLVTLIAGCASPERQAARREAEEQAQRNQQQNYRNWLGSTCAGYGIKYESPQMAQCMMQVDQNEQARRAAIGAAILGNQPKPYQATPYQVPLPVQTNCIRNGIYTSCTSR